MYVLSLNIISEIVVLSESILAIIGIVLTSGILRTKLI